MVPIIEEVTAALLALCVAVADRAAAPGEGSAGGSAGEPTTAPSRTG
jgi:hypothetical protein